MSARARVFMDRGEIVEEAPGAAFFDAPKTERAQRFLQQFEDIEQGDRSWGWKAILGALAVAGLAGGMRPMPAEAQQTQSRLYEVTKSKKLRVCQFPLYYSISFRNPKSGQDRGHRRRPRQGAGQGARRQARDRRIELRQLHRRPAGQQVRDRHVRRRRDAEARRRPSNSPSPTCVTNIYAVTRKDSKIKKWEDVDQKGVKAAVSLGSYIEPFMKSYLKNAEVVSVAPPNTREAELVAQRVDVIITDFPTAIKVTDEFDWADLSAAEREARDHALRLRRAAGRPDLAELHQPVRRHDQARRPADEVRQEAQARPDRGAVRAIGLADVQRASPARWKRRHGASEDMFKYQFRWDTVSEQLRLPDVGAADDADHLGHDAGAGDGPGPDHRAARHVALRAAALDRHLVRRGHPQHADPGAAAVGLLRAADRVRRAHRMRHGAGHRPVALPGRLHLRGLPLGHPGACPRAIARPPRCWG